MDENNVYGVFDDDEVVLDAIRNIRAEGVEIKEVYSPFAVHGMEDALGLRITRIPIAAFMIGLAGLIFIFLFMSYIFVIDWPVNIGGKPYLPLPAFIPPMFEFTVLCTGIGLLLLLGHTCKFAPSPNKHPIDPRITDDKFIIEITPTKKTGRQKIESLLISNGATEIKGKEKDA